MILLLLSIFLVRLLVYAQTVTVSSLSSHPIPTTLWGQMFEDISSGDGGLYAELLQNRAFQQVIPGTTAALNAWAAVGSAEISVVADSNPVSTSLPNSLSVVIPAGSSGNSGFSNSGYFGININSSWIYNASFYYQFPQQSTFSGTVTVSLQSSSGTVFASANGTLSANNTGWVQTVFSLKPTTTVLATDNFFVVTLNSAAFAGITIHFAMFSLFPPTFKNRPNGMRIDIAETLAAMGPSIWRFPGGNNLGQTVTTRWQWNTTVGSLLDRPGRVGDWGYVNTDGLGIFEFLTWIEDIGAEPIMAIWDGFSLGGTVIAEDALGPYIQQAIDQINFVIGDPGDSEPAALRASLGHPDPFPLTYVEVGNEDFISSTSTSTAPYRWQNFVDTLSSTFPSLHFMATTDTFNPILTPDPTEYDVHVYQTPRWFADNSQFYDGFERNTTRYFEGEYAAISLNSSDIFGTSATGRLTFPTMESSTGEAAFMTGLERNSDIVFAASYAPLLNHVVNSQWTPNLVSFDANAVYPSTSYYVQKLFSLNRGNAYIPSTVPPTAGNVFWSVVEKTSVTPHELIIKVSNTVATEANVTFVTPFTTLSTAGTVQLLAGAQNTSNSPTTPGAVAPVNSTVATGATFTYLAPGYSVSVITISM